MNKDNNNHDMGKLGAIAGVAGAMIGMFGKGDSRIPFPLWIGLGVLLFCFIVYIRDRKMAMVFSIAVPGFIMSIIFSIPDFVEVTFKMRIILGIIGISQLFIVITIMVYIKGILRRYKVEEAKKILSSTVPTIIVLVVILILVLIFL
ncbi:hypothetical protein [uncultured Clostridium sp.]|uniref:hypothetical protein n=1 Tax=uncultured Clostridium sp. TaxID=59620 RepID=UPI0025E223BE|nr:hypothetical protein [uncultured Clostridium sp.]